MYVCIQLFQLRLSPKTREKVEYERERLIGKTSFIPEYIIIHRFSIKFNNGRCLINISRDYLSLETKFCSVCVFLIVTPMRAFCARIRLFRFARGQP